MKLTFFKLAQARPMAWLYLGVLAMSLPVLALDLVEGHALMIGVDLMIVFFMLYALNNLANDFEAEIANSGDQGRGSDG